MVDTPIHTIKKEMDTNYLSTAYMAQATLQHWLKADSLLKNHSTSPAPMPRHLIFTSSFLALLTIAGYAAYSPTKAALRSLSDTLSMEMKLYESTHVPMAIHTVFPATIYTESYEAENKIKSDLTRKLEEDDAGQTPEEVAKWSVEGLENGDELITTAWLTRAVMCGVLGGSRRNGWGVVDTVLSWVISIVLVFVRIDMDSKVKQWGARHGVSGMKAGKKSGEEA